MSRCEPIRELLPAYIDNEMDADQRDVLEGHLLTCPDCREEIESLRKDDRLLQATIRQPVAVGESFNDSVWARIEQEDRARTAQRPVQPVVRIPSPQPTGGFTRRFRIPNLFPKVAFGVGGGLAVAMAVLFAIVFMHGSRMGPMDLQVASVSGAALWQSADSSSWQPLTTGMIMHAGDHFKTPAGGRIAARWKDGSRAVLGPEGEGEVLHLIPGVELQQGQLWAKVKKRASKESPFTVKTTLATAQAMGTEFVVAVSADRGAATLTVQQGAVYFFNAAGAVTVKDWAESQVAMNTAPTAPISVSPLTRSSLWWIK